MLLAELTGGETLDVDELIEIALHAELFLQAAVGIVRRLWTRLGKKDFLYHRIDSIFTDKP
jgi:hypothetical protein